MSEKTCEGCGAVMKMKPYDWPKNFASRRFCSVKCRARYGPKRQPGPVQEKTCVACGNVFQKSRGEGKRWLTRQHCTTGCALRGRSRDTHWLVKHSASDDPVYKVWTAMRQRCLNPNSKHWNRYGGRGISVCDRWNSFDAFAADMGPRPSGSTLERIDNDRGYSPDNCRWASRREQSNNTSNNRLITVGRVTKTVRQWERDLGFKRGTVSMRLRLGWPADKAVMTPPIIGQKIMRFAHG